jgi:ABC-type nitrate/sulfonate/bicarbonate transport system ATPase subunit
LAAFITELATARHESSLVFDNPVTSLDHVWRRKVTKRLVEEASVRQIIVFTHDLVSVNDLEHDAGSLSMPMKLISLSRTPAGTGVVSLDAPWRASGVKDRVDKMEKEARAAKALYDSRDDAAYGEAVRHRVTPAGVAARVKRFLKMGVVPRFF